MGNDNSCKVVGEGEVKLKMYDGTVRTIKRICHVPRLKKNLLSLGKFNKLGCTYNSEKGYSKVSKGALVVMKARKCEHNLYKMIRETIAGEAEVAIAGAMDLVTLWH